MYKIVKQEILASVLVLATFITSFFLLQIPEIYNLTIGNMIPKYEYEVVSKKIKPNAENKPFTNFTYKNVINWDAAQYKNIRDHLYKQINLDSEENLAFYPMFPVVWRFSLIDSKYIVFFNYFLFIAGLIILSTLFMGSSPSRLTFFLLALILPSAIVFYLPYAESLFVLTMAVAIWGLFKQKYWIYFIGAFMFSLTRPSSLIFMVALLSVDFVYYIRHGHFKHFIKELSKTLFPYITGFIVITGIQFYYTHSLTAYFDALELWPVETGLFNPIKDWSVEGFGMNSFAICCVGLPAFVYVIIFGIRSLISFKKDVPVSLYGDNTEWKKEYLYKASLFFIVGNVFHAIFISGDEINGFSRYTMSVPFFFIILFSLPKKLQSQKLKNKIILLLLCLSALFMFLAFVDYGGNRFRFQYMGLYLFIAFLPFVIFEANLSRKVKLIILFLMIIPCIIWQTYLFNIFLSNGWLYT
ncbi:MAG TPA: hypothetical protein VNZ49_02420 [Bacteroidia bacterium]|jgi:hypothetical protein|nr:hypothetical protein [Bacteroidia bacterium]